MFLDCLNEQHKLRQSNAYKMRLCDANPILNLCLFWSLKCCVDSMEAMWKLDEDRIQIKKMNLICGSRGLEEVRPTSKES